jgi:DNA-binding MarR family transcriptional regulator
MGYILHKAAMISKNTLTNNLCAYNLTPGQYTVLKVISHNNQNAGLSPAIIAEKLDCDRPTISGIIDRLETQGWIMRLPNPEDKRSYIITLTEKADRILSHFEEIKEANNNILLKGFQEDEAILFKNYLSRVIDNFKDVTMRK